MPTFPSTNDNFKPSIGSRVVNKADVLRADFGDGYTQRAANGLNNVGFEYSLIWRNVPIEDGQDMIDFFEARGGWESFDWLDILQEFPSTIQVVCEDWNRAPISENYETVTATFVRVYDL